jgi:AbrB family looped-hinge helix DNA binding protein
MRITSKGQVTIPQEIREQLGLLPYSEVEFEIDGDSVRIRKARRRGGRGAALIARMRGTAKPGMRYRASIDDPVMVGSQTAIPRGANCTLEVVSLQQGSEMALRLREINVEGKAYSTSTQYADVAAQGTSKSKKAVRRGVGLGAIGAGIGAIAGGGSGAAIGAAVGGGVGAVSGAAAKGKQINVATETRLIFALSAPLPMN